LNSVNGTSLLRGSRYRLRIDEFDRLTAARGWSTDTLRAEAIGVSKSTIHRLRRGAQKATDPDGSQPGARFIDLATAALGVPVEFLFEREEAA